MDKQKNSFTTSFGRTIEFVPGHLEFIKKTVGLRERIDRDWEKACVNNTKEKDTIDYEKVNQECKESRRTLSLHGYASRLSRVHAFLELARNTNITFPFKKCLDIGCGYAIQPRIMKGLGLIEESVGIDIYDRANAIDSKNLERQHGQLYRLRAQERLLNHIAKIPPKKRKSWHDAAVVKLQHSRMDSKKYNGWMHGQDFFQQKIVRHFTLDRMIAGNIFALEEQFDLITSFSSLEWFETTSIMKKIAALLEVGGIFYLWVPNWWHAVNTTLLAGHFPYACQRLIKDDFFRYAEECFPNNAQAMKVAYGYFDPNHPTLSDYIRIGFENGLVPLAHYSNIIPDAWSLKYAVHPLGYFTHDSGRMQEVLDDVHCFRPDIRVEDLLPRIYTFIFQKNDTTRQMCKEDFEHVYQDLESRYRPVGDSVLKRAYRVYKRFRP